MLPSNAATYPALTVAFGQLGPRNTTTASGLGVAFGELGPRNTGMTITLSASVGATVDWPGLLGPVRLPTYFGQRGPPNMPPVVTVTGVIERNAAVIILL